MHKEPRAKHMVFEDINELVPMVDNVIGIGTLLVIQKMPNNITLVDTIALFGIDVILASKELQRLGDDEDGTT